MFHIHLTTSTPTPITNYIAFFFNIKQLIREAVKNYLADFVR